MGKQIVKAQKIQTVDSLVMLIKEEIEKCKGTIIQYVDYSKLKSYWNIGMYIKQHLEYKKGAENYGEYLFKSLSRNLKVSIQVLHDNVRLYEYYPEIVNSANLQCSWTHYRLLVKLKDPDVREKYRQLVITKNLSVIELKKKLIDANLIKPGNKNQRLLLSDIRFLPGYYKLKYVDSFAKLQVDCGFRIYRDLPISNTEFTADEIVNIQETNGSYAIEKATGATLLHLYSYKAFVKEIIDGDTLWLDIILGLGLGVGFKVRLRGVNTPAIETADGIKVKDYIVSCLSGCPFILIKTHSRDKYNRYLVDIFYKKRVATMNELIENGCFLNQELLDKGLAVKYEM